MEVNALALLPCDRKRCHFQFDGQETMRWETSSAPQVHDELCNRVLNSYERRWYTAHCSSAAQSHLQVTSLPSFEPKLR